MDLNDYLKESEGDANDFTKVPKDFKSGFVSFIGRPNSGKSTLINSLINEKIAITSNVANTTRHRFAGIINKKDYQIIIYDTPGIHKPKDALSEELNVSAEQAATDVDIICILIDATKKFGSGDKFIIDKFKNTNSLKFCLLTKIDKAKKDDILKQLKEISSYFDFDEYIPISSIKRTNLELLEKLLVKHLSLGHRWFGSEQTNDVEEEVFISELIREQILKNVTDEIPHSTGVLVEDIDFNKNTKTTHIFATIIVERDSQVGIIVGSAGKTLKKIGVSSRHEIEKYIKGKVNLKLNVKVKKNWRKNVNYVRRFGYGQ